jgi:uncharacterized protein (TIGR02246 family)
MRRIVLSVTCCALSVLAGCATGSSASGGSRDTTSDEAAIRKLDQQWVQAIAAKDLDKTVSFYSPDARLMPPNQPPSVGSEQIRKSWTEFLKTRGMSLVFEPTVVRVSPDGTMAYDVGTYTFSADSPDGGRQQHEGKYTQVWQKRDGNWKVVVDMFNSNQPPPRPPQ